MTEQPTVATEPKHLILIDLDAAIKALSEHFLVSCTYVGRGRLSAVCNCGIEVPVFATADSDASDPKPPSAETALGGHLREVLDDQHIARASLVLA